MKLIVAIIPPESLDAVRASLVPEGRILSIGQVFSDRHEMGTYRGREVRIPRPELRLEIAVTDWLVETVVESIVENALTPESRHARDDKVFVLPMNEGGGDGFQDEEHLFQEPSSLPRLK